MIVVDVLAVLVVWVLPSYLVGKLAQRRGHDLLPMFVISLLVSPLIGLVVVLLGEEGERAPPSPTDRVDPETVGR